MLFLIVFFRQIQPSSQKLFFQLGEMFQVISFMTAKLLSILISSASCVGEEKVIIWVRTLDIWSFGHFSKSFIWELALRFPQGYENIPVLGIILIWLLYLKNVGRKLSIFLVGWVLWNQNCTLVNYKAGWEKASIKERWAGKLNTN